MPVVRTNPIRLWGGTWNDGFALNRHTGDTTRTALGQLVYELKYKSNWGALESIVETAEDFVRNGWQGLPSLDVIVPAPPSVTARGAQPVVEIARELARRLGIGLCENAVIKTDVTVQMKNVNDLAQRHQILRQTIQQGTASVQGRRLLILDDLYQSGATLRRVTDVLQAAGASEVYVLALTRTK